MVVREVGRVVGYYGLAPTAVVPASLPRSIRTGQSPDSLRLCLIDGKFAAFLQIGTYALKECRSSGLANRQWRKRIAKPVAQRYPLAVSNDPRPCSSVMLNRDDVANVQYSLRKLESHGLIQKIKEPGSKVHAFDVTNKGRKACEEFSVIRRELLIESVKGLENLNEKLGNATHFLSFLTGVYEEVSRTSAALSHTTTKIP